MTQNTPLGRGQLLLWRQWTLRMFKGLVVGVWESGGIIVNLATPDVCFCFGGGVWRTLMLTSSIGSVVNVIFNTWPDSEVIVTIPVITHWTLLLFWRVQWLECGKVLRGFFFFSCRSSSRNVPNRYTFPCPYCPEKNFDQEGLVEHCKLSHSTDTKSVVRGMGFCCFPFYEKKSDLQKN